MLQILSQILLLLHLPQNAEKSDPQSRQQPPQSFPLFDDSAAHVRTQHAIEKHRQLKEQQRLQAEAMKERTTRQPPDFVFPNVLSSHAVEPCEPKLHFHSETLRDPAGTRQHSDTVLLDHSTLRSARLFPDQLAPQDSIASKVVDWKSDVEPQLPDEWKSHRPRGDRPTVRTALLPNCKYRYGCLLRQPLVRAPYNAAFQQHRQFWSLLPLPMPLLLRSP